MLAEFHTFLACQDEAYSPRFQLSQGFISPTFTHNTHTQCGITGKVGQENYKKTHVQTEKGFTCCFLKTLISCASAPQWGCVNSFWDTASDGQNNPLAGGEKNTAWGA